jgi:hypothetical protein
MATSRSPYPQPGWGIFFSLPTHTSSQPTHVSLIIAAGLRVAYDVVGAQHGFGRSSLRLGVVWRASSLTQRRTMSSI